MTNDYAIPAQAVELCYEVKKSKFIARLAPCSDRDSAMQLLDQARADYPDARHHCWAYLFGSPAQPLSQAFNDDGEPSGTAGKPILNVLNHGDIGDIMVIIIRYFGGIKLGAGGLVRAYSTATQQAINTLPTLLKIATIPATLRLPFALENKCRHFLKQQHSDIEHLEYGSLLTINIHIPENAISELTAFCQSQHIDLDIQA